MDNIRNALQIIFGDQNPDEVLIKYFEKNEEQFSKNYKRFNFLKLAGNAFQNYSFDEIENVFQKLQEDWFTDVYKKEALNVSIFNLLIHFNKYVLTERENEPYVHYEHLLKWRSISHLLGEDFFTTSYLAYMDNRSGRQRSYYSWRPCMLFN